MSVVSCVEVPAPVGVLLGRYREYLIVERGGFPSVTGQAAAIVTLLVMVLVSWTILQPVTDAPRDWNALQK